MIFLYCVRNQILLASVSILKLASRSRSSDREEEQPIYIAAKNIFDNSPMFGNDAYNQSSGVSGVTYNCGGELLWPVLVFFFKRQILTHLHIQIAGPKSFFGLAILLSAASAVTASYIRNGRSRVSCIRVYCIRLHKRYWLIYAPSSQSYNLRLDRIDRAGNDESV